MDPADNAIRDAILAAPDVVKVPTTEPITEPSGVGMTRVTQDAYSSATVEVGKTYVIMFGYLFLPSSKSWGAMSGFTEAIEG